MKTEIRIGDYRKVWEFPADVDLVGVTVIRGGSHFSAIDGLEDLIDGVKVWDEEIALDCGVRVTFHYYNSKALREICEGFAGFEGMKFVEIQEDDFCLTQII